MTENKIPKNTEELTEEWFTTALKKADVIKNSKVIFFDTRHIGQEWGFTGEIARVNLCYDVIEDNTPDSLVVKFPNSSCGILSAYKVKKDKSEKAIRLHLERCEREILFYRHMGKEMSVGIPEMYYAESDPENGKFILLLEDLRKGYMGDALRGCTLEEAEVVIKEMAKFHAIWWDSSELEKYPWFTPYWGFDWELKQGLYEQRLEQFLARFAHKIPLYVRDLMSKLNYCYGSILQKLGQPPFTLVHKDLHLDNIYFNPRNKDKPVSIIDWQSVGIGRGVIEFANFMFGSLSTEQRRASEGQLMNLYYSELVNRGVSNYKFEDFFDDCRMVLLWQLGFIVIWLSIINFQDYSGREREFINKIFDNDFLFSALEDHKVKELLPL